MSRAFLIVMDSVGIGGAPDADRFFNAGAPDTGADTVGHIRAACAPALPTLDRLGLAHAHALATGAAMPPGTPEGAWGAATPQTPGKDTVTGHWELTGAPIPFLWHTFPDTSPAFPAELSAAIAHAAGADGILGDCHASGTEIIDRLGAEHLRTGRPIAYTSVDSVVQIAAHEEAFGLDRLRATCEALAPRLHALRVGRVIARPFTGAGTKADPFRRTGNRKDYAMQPPAPTLLDRALASGRAVHSVGKIGDIFAHRATGTEHKGGGDAGLAQHLLRLAADAEPGSLTVANFVEFDSEYGHRRDVAGYARHLEWFDNVAGKFLTTLWKRDLAVFTADHGNDPTWAGTDHTRERVPVLAHGLGSRSLGHLVFSDVGALVAAHLGLPA